MSLHEGDLHIEFPLSGVLFLHCLESLNIACVERGPLELLVFIANDHLIELSPQSVLFNSIVHLYLLQLVRF